jgi:HlyD family secretion protein
MKKFFKSKITISIIVVVVLIFGGIFLFSNHDVKYQFVAVTRGPITETVSLTGNTTPSQSVSLGFNSSGSIAHIYSALGKKVTAGKILAEENTNDLIAQLHNMQAGLAIAKQNATTSKNNLTNVTTEQNTLVANAYSTLLNSTPAAEVIGNDMGYDAPTVTGTYVCNKEGTYNLKTYSSTSGISVNYSGLEQGSFLLTDVPRPLGKCGLFLSFDKTKNLQPGIEFNVNIPNKNTASYNTNYNAYQLALQTREKTIADAKANIETNDSVSSVADAQIAQAKANIEIAQAKLADARIVAPISGTITQFDAKIGQLATVGTPLISIISNNGYEVDAGVSETDIGKVVVGDKVSMTFDAFKNDTFSGTVFYIAPSETNNNGVISYLVKISFDKNDARLKSGLTANIDIQTKYKDNVLILPQYAILQNDQGTYVETLVNKKVVQTPVVLGIEDQKGNVEVISGVTLGEKVINIGLKS